ncbi:TusA-related sulfurtransferase [Bacillus mycoides]
MLDKIHKEFYKVKGGLLEVLRGKECPIFFTFKDLNNIGSGEELYIKMNARGRALSDFENFKAQFEQLLEVLDYNDKAKEFSFTLDREWTDFLWPYLDDSKTLDKPFLRLFNFISSSKISRIGTVAPNTFNKDYTNFKELRTIYKEEENVTFLFDIFTIWKDAEQIESEFSSIHEQIHLFTDERNYFKAFKRQLG